MTKPPLDLTETPLSSQQVFDGRLLHVHVDQVGLPDGKKTVREYITHPGAVVIKALAKKADERYQTAHELGLALQAALEAPCPVLLPPCDTSERPGWVARTFDFFAQKRS